MHGGFLPLDIRARSATRANELTAVSEAIAIITEDDNRELMTKTVSLLQRPLAVRPLPSVTVSFLFYLYIDYAIVHVIGHALHVTGGPCVVVAPHLRSGAGAWERMSTLR